MGAKKLINFPNDELDNIINELNRLSEENKRRLQDLFPDINFSEGTKGKEDDSENISKDENVYFCRRCGKIIKNPLSIHMNMGPICFRHYCEEHKNPTKKLF